MKILVLGAGTVGTSVAAALAAENNDITVVDTDALRLREPPPLQTASPPAGNGAK